MKKSIISLVFLIASLAGCGSVVKENNDYLIAFNDTIKDQWGYINMNGQMVMPLGKYARCFTDTFRTYAIVVKQNSELFIAIDRQENVLYEVFPFDNGPDYPSEGLFRILVNSKIGFADSATGMVVIKPQFDCARAFENGVAEVSSECKTQKEGEHSICISDHWYYIDKTGNKVKKP